MGSASPVVCSAAAGGFRCSGKGFSLRNHAVLGDHHVRSAGRRTPHPTLTLLGTWSAFQDVEALLGHRRRSLCELLAESPGPTRSPRYGCLRRDGSDSRASRSSRAASAGADELAAGRADIGGPRPNARPPKGHGRARHRAHLRHRRRGGGPDEDERRAPAAGAGGRRGGAHRRGHSGRLGDRRARTCRGRNAVSATIAKISGETDRVGPRHGVCSPGSRCGESEN